MPIPVALKLVPKLGVRKRDVVHMGNRGSTAIFMYGTRLPVFGTRDLIQRISRIYIKMGPETVSRAMVWKLEVE